MGGGLVIQRLSDAEIGRGAPVEVALHQTVVVADAGQGVVELLRLFKVANITMTWLNVYVGFGLQQGN